MKKILYILCCLAGLSACTKEGDMTVAEEQIHTVKKNLYRANKIEGHHSAWGDFVLYLNYEKEALLSGIRVNSENDTIGNISASYSDNQCRFSVSDFIPNIDRDSIDRLDQALKEKYGAGNYSLKDSIPSVSRERYVQTVDLYTDGRVKRQAAAYYIPREDVGVGEDFDNSYKLTHKVINTYEYDANSNICINRIFEDVYDQEDIYGEKFDRSLYKTEATYDGGKIVALGWFTAKSGENFTEYNRYQYTYAGERIASIRGEGFSVEYAYNGNKVTVTKEGDSTAYYELDEHGNVIKMDDGKGNVYKIEYEAGHGNFSTLSFLSDQMTNPFSIK